MTVKGFKEIVQRHGGLNGVVQVGFDDNILFMIDSNCIITDEDLISVDDGDEALIRVKGFMPNKETGLCDIPVTVYRTLADIRNITIVDNIKDREKIDAANQYAY